MEELLNKILTFPVEKKIAVIMFIFAEKIKNGTYLKKKINERAQISVKM